MQSMRGLSYIITSYVVSIVALSFHAPYASVHNVNLTKTANRSFENVPQFKYFVTTVTNQNLIQEKIKRRLNSGNACYNSVQNFSSSRLLSKN
jgi:hypothetical protein